MKNINTRIELATIEQVPEIYDLLKDFAQQRGLSKTFTLTEDRLMHLFQVHGLGALLIYADDKIIGTTTFYETMSTFSGMTGLYIEDMYIHHDYQRMGIGKKLLDAMIEETNRRGYPKLEWQCAIDNQGAMTFYRKMGAVQDDHWKSFIYYLDDHK